MFINTNGEGRLSPWSLLVRAIYFSLTLMVRTLPYPSSVSVASDILLCPYLPLFSLAPCSQRPPPPQSSIGFGDITPRRSSSIIVVMVHQLVSVLYAATLLSLGAARYSEAVRSANERGARIKRVKDRATAARDTVSRAVESIVDDARQYVGDARQHGEEKKA